MKSKEFLELNIEEQSIFIRSLFERATEKYGQEDKSLTDDDFERVVEYNNKLYIIVMQDNANNLTSYNESLFPEASHLAISDDEIMVEISLDILRRYCSINALKNLNNLLIKMESDYEKWKENPAILDKDKGMMHIVVRGLASDGEKTPSYFYCDAQRIITEQLAHYKIHFPRVQNASPIAYELFKNMTFPSIEGRDAYYCIFGVPFSPFNGRTFNDSLCLFLNITTSQNYAEIYWPISEKGLTENGAFIEVLQKDHGVSLLPSVAERQKQTNCPDYIKVIRMPLPDYILACLRYQRHLELAFRIKKEDNTRTSDQELDHAIAKLSALMNQDKKLLSQNTMFFKSQLTEKESLDNRDVDTAEPELCRKY